MHSFSLIPYSSVLSFHSSYSSLLAFMPPVRVSHFLCLCRDIILPITHDRMRTTKAIFDEFII
ncbi:hypothetical protein C1H46_037408 [Malus baccata]|uniref:Uncharacterized protein n=1 Tax=Malus baccata TaxID=106549 RepID=A0A540KS70_MALBA|nr:hypothetical protein C1H46_037408 [Malus baccata]